MSKHKNGRQARSHMRQREARKRRPHQKHEESSRPVREGF